MPDLDTVHGEVVTALARPTILAIAIPTAEAIVAAPVTITAIPAALLIEELAGLRTIPRWIPVHKLVWRDYYRRRVPRG